MGEPTAGSFPEPLAERLLAELRVEIARADSKASVLIAALGLTSGLSGGAAANSGWSPGALPAAGQLLWWAGALALTASLTAFLLAVAPRYGRREWVPGAPLTYFGDIRRAAEQGLLPEALAQTDAARKDRLVRALDVNSRIATIKLCWVRIGLSAFAAGLLLVLTALVTG
jgi:pycsar effector protein